MASFAAFHQEVVALVGWWETRMDSEPYIRRLLVQQTDQRNTENVAEALNAVSTRPLRRFLTDMPWERTVGISPPGVCGAIPKDIMGRGSSSGRERLTEPRRDGEAAHPLVRCAACVGGPYLLGHSSTYGTRRLLAQLLIRL